MITITMIIIIMIMMIIIFKISIIRSVTSSSDSTFPSMERWLATSMLHNSDDDDYKYDDDDQNIDDTDNSRCWTSALAAAMEWFQRVSRARSLYHFIILSQSYSPPMIWKWIRDTSTWMPWTRTCQPWGSWKPSSCTGGCTFSDHIIFPTNPPSLKMWCFGCNFVL